jgi:hypothetical protein
MNNMVRLQVAIPAPTAEPRGSQLAAAAAIMVWNTLSLLWKRPQTEAAAGSASAEAQQVRELALKYRDIDRGFAADLLAAADRHEVLHEGR